MSTSRFSHRSYYLLSIPHPCQRFFMHGFRIRSGVFSGPRGLRCSLPRPLAEDMSAYACHRSIPQQAKYRCVNLVMRMLGSTNLSRRWATVGLLGYLFLRVNNRFGGMRDLAIFRGDTWDAGWKQERDAGILITSGSGISYFYGDGMRES